MARDFAALQGGARSPVFAHADPQEAALGSGGGMAHLLAEAWRVEDDGRSFDEWVQVGRNLVFLSGGESRRLPAYAPTGKLLLPIPVFRWARGQRLDQTLLDLQLPVCERVLAHAPPRARVLLASGDVLLRLGDRLPPFPEVDVLGLGVWAPPETAEQFGAFFMPRGKLGEIAFFLQKPKAARVRDEAGEHLCLVDTGIWLLSARALDVLMRRSGGPARPERGGWTARRYDFYREFAPCLGSRPTREDEEVQALSCAVVPLPEAQFFHFGTSRQMIESVARLQNLVLDESRVSLGGARQRPDQVTQNCQFPMALRREGNECFWVENSVLGEGWTMAAGHVLTGIPENDWRIRLPAGACLDVVPVGSESFCLRGYGLDDRFEGPLGAVETCWMAKPARTWFEERGLDLAEVKLDPDADIYEAPVFPVLAPQQLSGRFVQWLLSSPSTPEPEMGALWANARRLSARELVREANLTRLYEQRDRLRKACLPTLRANARRSVFLRLDLKATARVFAQTQESVGELEWSEDEALPRAHDAMFRAAVSCRRGHTDAERHEQAAFTALQSLIRGQAQVTPASPVCAVQEDQIVWARSPVRLDLAGGWTDTPPYCIEHGGKVVNVGVDLNGQPPVQVFARRSERRELVMRSIDLGMEERVRTYAELEQFGDPGAPFALAKAALALAGFLPPFHAAGGHGSLAKQLKAFGSGIEVTLLCAAPKGSGLGTSSILSATVLAALSDLCGLGWDRNELLSRTLALEQMLTTGGGWQDQAGALFRGVKLIETSPGLPQRPTVRWLPAHLFERDHANRTMLLYYTGITRLARNLLGGIVRAMLLNSAEHLGALEEIGANAEEAAAAVQACDYDGLAASVRRSWVLNQRLDPGANPTAVQAVLSALRTDLAGAKLLGAGGGGYLLMMAKNETAGQRIREKLTAHPLNRRSRFVNFSVSNEGLQVTRS